MRGATGGRDPAPAKLPCVYMCIYMPAAGSSTVDVIAVVVVAGVVLASTHRQNPVRGHRTGSNNS